MYETVTDRRERPELCVDLMVDILSTTLDEIEEYEQHLPCILICTARESGDQSVSGPFATRALGERILRHEVECAGFDSKLDFALLPLYPALELDEVVRA